MMNMNPSFFSFLLFAFLFLTNSGISLANELTFKPDGKFKIIQVTDCHFKVDSEYSRETIEMLQQVLDAEKPDLVVFTGDVVTCKPYRDGLDRVLDPVIKRKIPWVLLFGNHDDEYDMTREQLATLVQAYPYHIGKMKKVKGVTGYGNFVLEIKGINRKKTQALLYCMDSNAYSTLKPVVGGYGWMAHDQVAWYRQQSMKYTSANQQQPLPALAFFHIPLPEYRAADQQGTKITGVKLEKVCSPEINTGMFAAMLERGDVMGTFVGHDHINDYIFNHYGIALAYGRFSGSKTTYTELKNGVRVIELTEGQRGFDTWIRLNEEVVINQVRFPDDLPLK
ncbi:MAG: metallophosphoesterase family protein [Bacteroidales bacterium]|nr:metallophosphoesterase family protein [Bacteroidales bacterium]